MPMILMLNLKGGVAKTTNTIAIAETLAARGKKVLVVDADHQYTASELLLTEAGISFMEDKKRTLHDLFREMLNEDFSPKRFDHFKGRGATNIKEIKDLIDCIPASPRIDELQTNLAKARRGFMEPEKFLDRIKRKINSFHNWCELNYHYTLVDCPPSIATQVRFMLGCGDYYISPSVPDRLSVRGTDYLVRRIRKRKNTKIKPLGTLWSMVRQIYTHKSTMQDAKQGTLQHSMIPVPFMTVIPNTEDIAKIMNFEGDYNTYKQKYGTKTARIYNQLSDEIERRIN